jgi:hypothetical protein
MKKRLDFQIYFLDSKITVKKWVITRKSDPMHDGRLTIYLRNQSMEDEYESEK